MSDSRATDPPAGEPRIELSTSTTLVRDGGRPDRYRLRISPDWTIVDVFGGVSMYSLLRAMTGHIDRPELEVQQMTALFLAPVPAGELIVDVEVLRAGRRTVQVAADLRTPDGSGPLVRAHAVFGAPDQPSAAGPAVAFPSVPTPAELDTRPHNAEYRVPMGERTDWRPIDGGADEGTVLAWERLREGEPHREALVVFGDILGAAVEATSTSFVLSLEISIRFIRTPVTPWVLQEAQVWHAGDGYATGPARLWDEAGNLCAIVQQTALLRPAPQG